MRPVTPPRRHIPHLLPLLCLVALLCGFTGDYHAAGIQHLILFSSDKGGDMELYVMHTDGTQVRQLTSNHTDDDYGRWTPDGKKILFTRGGGEDRQIWLMNSDGSGQEYITDGWSGDISPDGKKAVVSVRSCSGYHDLYVCDTRTEKVTRLTASTADCFHPDYAGSGKQIAYQKGSGSIVNIWRIKSDCTGNTRLTSFDSSHRGCAVNPTWGAKSGRIAHEAAASGQPYYIYVMNSNGGGKIKPFASPSKQTDPVWSPDETKLLFSADDNSGRARIYVGNMQTRKARVLLDNGANAYPCDWR
ncbi:MAG: hypothetical protein V2A77_09240 [Pseudomonadota bacterium]